LLPRLWEGRRLEEIHLAELSRGACERLAAKILGEGVERDVLRRIAARSQGNPFYLEELVRAVAQGASDDFPETGLVMVGARFARLQPELRQVLRAASVFGETFWDGGLAPLLGAGGVGPLLDELARMEWVMPALSSRFFEHTELRFAHALLHEAAYGSLTDD